MKICVYAIAKNEAKHVERFCKSAEGADYIVIADTGSEDETVALARERGATVHSISVVPFRFDTARNAALALVPADTDICVSLDLDETLEPGWREEVERVWTDGVTRLKHLYAFTKEHIFHAQKIHARHGYTWKYPCHEFQEIDPSLNEITATTDMLLISHDRDLTKSRSQYMDILRRATMENRDCSRSAYYYAREMYYENMAYEAIAEFDRFLSMPKATWDAERSYARRAIGECYEALGDNLAAERSYMLACAEQPYARDGWLALARYYYRREMWRECYGAIGRCLSISTRNYDFTAMAACWGYEPYDLMALAAYHTMRREEARFYGEKALEFDPGNARLIRNLAWYSCDDDGKLEAAE